jgi:glycine amidinotransferase
MAQRTVHVESEFAPLRTVVVAQSQFRTSDLASLDPAQVERELSILPAEQQAYVRFLAGRDLAEADPDRQRAWEAERAALCALLEGHGIEVLRPRLLTDFEKQAAGVSGYLNGYVRDPWFTVGSFVVEGSLRFPHRRIEVLPSRPILVGEVLPSADTYVAVPQPELLPLDVDGGGPGPFLEGGDVLVHGRHVFVGSSGRASTPLGARWLAHLLEPAGYAVELVRLAPDVLHLDCALGLVREGLAVVHEGALLDGLPASLEGWDLVTVTAEEAMALGTNGLPLTPDRYVTDPAFERIGEQIARHGITVEYLGYDVSRGFGGSFRCSTQPLWRA